MYLNNRHVGRHDSIPESYTGVGITSRIEHNGTISPGCLVDLVNKGPFGVRLEYGNINIKPFCKGPDCIIDLFQGHIPVYPDLPLSEHVQVGTMNDQYPFHNYLLFLCTTSRKSWSRSICLSLSPTDDGTLLFRNFSLTDIFSGSLSRIRLHMSMPFPICPCAI